TDSTSLTLFFFYSHAYHRHLHSFPTRRSSDLVDPCATEVVIECAEFGRARQGVQSTGAIKRHIVGEQRIRCRFIIESVHGARQRSEEHTSELQSRGHLVCRLLLEKKNYYYKHV